MLLEIEAALAKKRGRKGIAESVMDARMLARPYLERIHPASFWRYEPYTAALAYHWIKNGASDEDVGRALEIFYEYPTPTNSIAGTIARMRGPGENKEKPSEEWKVWDALGRPEGSKALWLLREAARGKQTKKEDPDALIKHTEEEALEMLTLVKRNVWESWFKNKELLENKDACAFVAELVERDLPSEIVASAVRVSFDIELPWWVYEQMRRREDDKKGFIMERLRARLSVALLAEAKTRADNIERIYTPIAHQKKGGRPDAVVAGVLATSQAEEDSIATLRNDPLFAHMVLQLESGQKTPDLTLLQTTVDPMLVGKSSAGYETGMGLMITPLVNSGKSKEERAGEAQRDAFMGKLERALRLARKTIAAGGTSPLATLLHSLPTPIERIIIRKRESWSYLPVDDLTFRKNG